MAIIKHIHIDLKLLTFDSLVHPMDQPINQTYPSIPRNMEVPASISGFMKSFLSLPQISTETCKKVVHR